MMEAIADGRPTLYRTALQRDFINKMPARVPEEPRWLFIAKEGEGFFIAELSQMNGVSEKTIKGKLFRVRQGFVAAAGRLRSRSGSIVSAGRNCLVRKSKPARNDANA
jgi:DNA-directed RNA polymerase specialized sigma24 family protein